MKSTDGCIRVETHDFNSATVAGLEAHLGSHVGASVLQGGYTPGVATAVPVTWPGALLAKYEL